MAEPKGISGQLGFGTGNLYSGKNHQRSVMLVRAALDCGITWIDTAPLYGHGAAETIVGEAIRGRRDGLTLVSKAGIEPSRITLPYRLHAKAASLTAKLPRGHALLPAPEPPRPRFDVFAPADIDRSVERSLKALGTDRLDYLLLHEVDAPTAVDPALLDTLGRLVEQGKVLAFGTATQTGETLKIAASPKTAGFALFQVAGDALSAELVPPRGAGLVLHSLLVDRLAGALQRLRCDDHFRDAARRFGIDPDRPDLARRLMAHAANQPNVRAALFSTSDIDRLRDLASASELAPDEAEAGARLIAWGLSSESASIGHGRGCMTA